MAQGQGLMFMKSSKLSDIDSPGIKDSAICLKEKEKLDELKEREQRISELVSNMLTSH